MIKLLRFVKPYAWAVVAVVVLEISQIFADLSLPNLLSRMIDVGIAQADRGVIWQAGLAMLGLTVLSVACSALLSYFASRIGAGLGRDLRRALFTQVETFSLAEFDGFGTSSLITRNTNDVMQVQGFMVMFLRVVLMAPLMCIGGLVMALGKNARLATLIVAAMPVLVLLVVLVSRRAIPLFQSMQGKLDKLNRVTRENLTGMRVIRAFITEKHEKERFQEASRDLMETTIRVQRMMALLMPAMMILLNGLAIALVAVGGGRIQAGAMATGDLIAMIQYLMQIMMALIMMSMIFVMMPRAQVSANRINAVLDCEPSIQDPAQPKASSGLKGYVRFDHVSFRYPGAEEDVLHDISFEAKPGQTTAFIGSTGSGKSTLINLVPRFYDVTSGSVKVDGVDVRQMSQHELRDKIGYVPQRGVLFSGTIASNIGYGLEQPEAKTLELAAEVAQASEFIARKEKGMEEPIAQGGTNVSGGQRQRLAIARAVAKEPEIYIFDDSFSALDFKTDAALRARLKQQTRQATVLIVGQRVSSIMDADTIVVLDEGRVAGMGTHRQLLDSCPVYREIAASQLSEEELSCK